MATTTRSRAEGSGGAAVRVAVLAAGLAVSPVQAQTWGLELGVSSELTWTSNSSFGVAAGESDTILELRPRMRVFGEGARLRLSGSASVGGLAYARRTQPNTVEPTADLSARLEAIERLFFVEIGYRAAQTSENPFGVRADAGSSTNRVTTSQWRFSPIIEGAAGGDVRYHLRSDNTWTRAIGGTDAAISAGAGGYFGRHAVAVEHDPRPFGWRLEADRSYTRFDDPAEPTLAITTARAILNYAVTEEWSVGARGGRERNNVAAEDLRSRTIYGLETRWQPTPRTTLSAFREKRFFGSGWDFAFAHRRPRLAWTIGLSRGVDTTPQALLDLPATDNVTGLIDAMFTTRFPDPVERARAVQDFIAKQGLPSSTQGPISLFAPRFSLVTGRRASLSLLGARDTLTFSGFSTRTEDALDQGTLAIGAPATNNTQRGGSMVLSHRLSPLTALSLTLDWSRIRALDAPDETTQQGLRVHFTIQAAPLTSTFVGGRWRKIDSNVAAEGREGAVFMGLDHRF